MKIQMLEQQEADEDGAGRRAQNPHPARSGRRPPAQPRPAPCSAAEYEEEPIEEIEEVRADLAPRARVSPPSDAPLGEESQLRFAGTPPLLMAGALRRRRMGR